MTPFAACRNECVLVIGESLGFAKKKKGWEVVEEGGERKERGRIIKRKQAKGRSR